MLGFFDLFVIGYLQHFELLRYYILFLVFMLAALGAINSSVFFRFIVPAAD